MVLASHYVEIDCDLAKDSVGFGKEICEIVQYFGWLSLRGRETLIFHQKNSGRARQLN